MRVFNICTIDLCTYKFVKHGLQKSHPSAWLIDALTMYCTKLELESLSFIRSLLYVLYGACSVLAIEQNAPLKTCVNRV